MKYWFNGEDWDDANTHDKCDYFSWALFMSILCACIAVGFAVDLLFQ